jgi:hypothetical protein
VAKDNHWFKHEYDADDGDNLVMLRLKGGNSAIGLYWRTYPKIHKASNRYPFATDTARDVLAAKLAVERNVLDDFITKAIECNLFKIVDGFLCSDKVAEQLEEQQVKSKNAAESGRLGGLANARKRQSKEVASGKRNVASRVEKSRSREDKNKDTLTSADFIFPFKLDSEIYKKATDEYIQYRKELKKPLTKISVNKLLGKYANHPAEFIQNLNHSMANGWQGVHAPSGNGAQKSKISNHDRNKEQLLKSLGEPNL